MRFNFHPDSGLILIATEIWGPAGKAIFTLALDTGATATLVSQSRLMQLGYDPSVQPARVQIITGSSIEFVPRFEIQMIKALGRTHVLFPIISHNLPANSGIDGLLGLDFLRGKVLNLDFQKGEIELG